VIQVATFCIVAVAKHYLGWGNWIWWVFGVAVAIEEIASLVRGDDE
jgi:hypothetical protein